MQKLWLKALAVLLIGYMAFDRGFAHIGVSPVYVGELVLVPGVLIALFPGTLTPALKTPLGILYVVFAAFSCFASAIPYLSTYAVDTVRDSALWIYGLFFLISYSLLIRRPEMLMKIPAVYGRALLWYTPVLSMMLVLRYVLHGNDETSGGSSFISIKTGDVGAHLAGVFAFLLLSLDMLWQRPTAAPRATVRYVIAFGGAFFSLVFVTAVNRGGTLAVVISIVIVSLLAPRLSWSRAAVIFAGAIVAAALVFGAAGAEVRISNARTLSLDQIETNVGSIFSSSGSSNTATSNTAKWRLDWWTKIVRYTFTGPYFWAGKGYGINLADSDGFRLDKADVLRSPHNSSMSVLARSGVPGFLLWLAMLTTFAFQMTRLALHARRNQRPVWSRVAIWCMVYWLAIIIDSCFDVALEGPQLGIWFWSLMGFGTALQYSYKEAFRLQDSPLRRRTVSAAAEPLISSAS